jgi:hypothetical protein
MKKTLCVVEGGRMRGLLEIIGWGKESERGKKYEAKDTN